jgi:hypothetical protein
MNLRINKKKNIERYLNLIISLLSKDVKLQNIDEKYKALAVAYKDNVYASIEPQRAASNIFYVVSLE